MYFAHQDGMLADQYWGEIERTMTDVIGYPGVQQWWKTKRHWHTEQFANLVDAIIARGGKPKAYATYDLTNVTAPSTEKRA